MKTDDLVIRIQQLINLAIETMESKYQIAGTVQISVRPELFFQLRGGALSFIENVYGREHNYYRDFDSKVKDAKLFDAKSSFGILNAIQSEIVGGWLNTMTGLISADIFSDFLDMAEHLLSEGYKDAAAVMIGSTLEEHLRQLCKANGIEIESEKNGKMIPKSSDLLNVGLAKTKV